MSDVTVVRIYCNEGETRLEKLLKRLHDWEHLKGVSVFRGIAGFGDSGKIHTGGLVDLAMELPLVVEFFDDSGKVDEILQHIKGEFKPGHILSFPAKIND